MPKTVVKLHIFALVYLILPVFTVSAQSLVVSSGSVSAAGTAALNVTLSVPSSAAAPSALQWTLTYPSSSISLITATAGTSAVTAGKSLSCAPATGSYKCILSGPNTTALAAGVVAVITVTAPSLSTNVGIAMTNSLGVSATGSEMPVTGTGGTLSGIVAAPSTSPAPATLKTLSCAPSALTSGASGSCTVTLASAASASLPIALTSNNAALTVPSSVTVAAQSSSATFSVQAKGTTTQNAVVTATLNGASVVATVSVSSSVTSMLRVNAGGSAYTDPSGQVWATDTGFAGAVVQSTFGQVRQTTTPVLYQTARTAGVPFTFTSPLPNGLYTVVLKFAEPIQTAPGQRSFNVDIDDDAALTDFDIFAEAGGQNIAVDRSFPTSVTSGLLSVRFKPGIAGAPLVNAIEVLSGTPPQSTSVPGTIRINAGGAASTDVSGLAWGADSGFTGGTPLTTTSTIMNSVFPTLYQSGRAGTSTYRFAVPNGTYSVVLKFAELAVSASRTRMFNVALNGTPVLTNFDIFAAAGAAFLAVDRAFAVTVGEGAITVELTNGAAGTPLLNGIEIIPRLP